MFEVAFQVGDPANGIERRDGRRERSEFCRRAQRSAEAPTGEAEAALRASRRVNGSIPPAIFWCERDAMFAAAVCHVTAMVPDR